jgi:hypothetical protein
MSTTSRQPATFLESATAKRRRKSGKKSKATLFTHKKFLWLRQVARDYRQLPTLASALCAELCDYFSLAHDGAAWPAQERLAQQLGVRREAINRTTNALIERGHLGAIRGGQHRSNVYRFILKEAPEQATRCAQNRTSEMPPDVRDSASRCAQNRTRIPLRTPVAPKKEPQGEGEREDRASRDNISLSAGAPPLTRPPAEEDPFLDIEGSSARRESKRPSEEESAPAAQAERNLTISAGGQKEDSGFADLRALWCRGWASDDEPKAVALARQAFALACREAKPADILDAAKTWVATADAPRFLPPLAKWLTSHSWEKPPPTKRKNLRHAGDGLPRTNGRKVDIAQVGFNLAAEYRAERLAREAARAQAARAQDRERVP